MKYTYTLDNNAYYYVCSWQSYCPIANLFPKGLYTSAYTAKQAKLQMRERIAKALHTPTYDIDIMYRDIKQVEKKRC